MDRTKTNRYVLEYSNVKLREERPSSQPIMWLSTVHEDMRIKMLYRIIKLPEDNPQKTITFQPNTLHPIDIGKRRHGRPRVKWINKTLEQAWHRLVHSEFTQYRYDNFDPDNPAHVTVIKTGAQADFIGYY
eukprot:7211888-Karenia_brevis.AAC.1